MRYVKEEIAKGRFETRVQIYRESIKDMVKYNAPRVATLEEIHKAIGMIDFAVTIGIIDEKKYGELRYEFDEKEEEV